MFEGFDTITMVLFSVCFLAVCVFEFVNGFHDTANAVATVIYTKTLKPAYAVIWSGAWNFLGVLLGTGVAMSILKLIPLADMSSLPISDTIALVFAMLVTAIAWNLGTWYFGIPCSSSHTLIGALLGGGIMFNYLHPGGDGVDWAKAGEIGLALVISPMFGFSAAILLMYIMRQALKKEQRTEIFKEPTDESKPPLWIRGILIATCTLVSYFHGSNDGQKGIALMLVVLISFRPVDYALGTHFATDVATQKIELVQKELLGKSKKIDEKAVELNEAIKIYETTKDRKSVMEVRKHITKYSKEVTNYIKLNGGELSKDAKYNVETNIKGLKKHIEDAPYWVSIVIALCLGLGTTIGWKRIVVTIGEKIGKRHMTYAEGAAAELMAASTIGLSTGFGLPVSTTHVLSSGIAGSMVASKGVKNLQSGTVKSIVLAWVLTLPVTIIGAASLYWIFYKLFI